MPALAEVWTESGMKTGPLLLPGDHLRGSPAACKSKVFLGLAAFQPACDSIVSEVAQSPDVCVGFCVDDSVDDSIDVSVCDSRLLVLSTDCDVEMGGADEDNLDVVVDRDVLDVPEHETDSIVVLTVAVASTTVMNAVAVETMTVLVLLRGFGSGGRTTPPGPVQLKSALQVKLLFGQQPNPQQIVPECIFH